MGRLWILGSAGWMPSRGQETSCYLVECDGQLIMLDAGTGVSNLYLVEDVLAKYEHLSILLSHYHLDHIAGLMYLKRFASSLDVDIYGPGQPVYLKTTEQYLSDVLQSAIYSSGPYGFARSVHYFDYGGQDFQVNDTHVTVTAQHHSSPSFQLRLGDYLVYATDVAFEACGWLDAAPAQVLLHECWQLSSGDSRHTAAEDLVRDLPRSAFERVFLIHHNPSWSADERHEVARCAEAAGIALAEDGMCVDLTCE